MFSRAPSRWLALGLLLGATAVGVAACGGGDNNGNSGPSTQDYVVAVRDAGGGGTAQFVAGSPPSGGSGPTAAVSSNGSVIPGGTLQAAVTAGQAFTTVIFSVSGADGYYRLTLPSATAAAELLVTLAQTLPATSFSSQIAVGASSSAVGAYATQPLQVVQVGTGDVQVSLSWSTAADVDLHVVDPSGAEIYFAQPQAQSGGVLDLDSNAGCAADETRNENVTWPVGGAPVGTYRVLVDYWSNCEVAETPYVVTVRLKGQSPQTFSGTLTGTGDMGGAGAGIAITEFSVGAATAVASAGRGVPNLGTVRVERRPGIAVHRK